jgi:predicted ATPase
MAITNIAVSNFKSFKQLDLPLGPFNVVIGANAAGKSNLVEAFRFLKAIEQESLEDAISLHGGRDSILNKKLDSSRPLRMRVTFDRQTPWAGGFANIDIREMTYEFGLQIDAPPAQILIKDDHLNQKLRTTAGDEPIEWSLDIVLSDGRRKLKLGPQREVDRIQSEGPVSGMGVFTSPEDLEKLRIIVEALGPRALLVNSPFFGLVASLEHSPLARVGVYDIDPRAVKSPHEMAGRASLEKDGANLALIIKQIRADAEKSRKFHNLLHYMLPFAQKIGTTQYLGTSILLKLRETYYDQALFANLLSDGTVDVVALIVALFFEDKDVVIIEEPERNIHPHLISGLMELMKDAARNKQVIITTHSPEVVRHAGVENLLLMSRDEEGFSTASRPAEKEEVKVFLENDLGLDEVFVQELWGR